MKTSIKVKMSIKLKLRKSGRRASRDSKELSQHTNVYLIYRKKTALLGSEESKGISINGLRPILHY